MDLLNVELVTELCGDSGRGGENAAYFCYYTTKPARKPVTYVTDHGNALGMGLSGCDIDNCYDADTEKFLPESAKGELGSTATPIAQIQSASHS
ncbi:MAG: hypothetical protein WBE44_13415 [Terriglobales bacterium]